MTTDFDLVALFGPTIDRTIDGAALRDDRVAELVLSTGVRHPFDRPWLIGRAPEIGTPVEQPTNVQRIDISHPMLSREHVCLSPVGRRGAVVDLGSTNGTVVVAPDREPIVCLAGQLVLIEIGWRVEIGGVVWLEIEPRSSLQSSLQSSPVSPGGR